MTKHHMLKLLTTFAGVLILVGCANTSKSGSGSRQATEQQVMSACLAASGQRKLLMLSVPAANNTISDQINVASLKLGGSSNSVEILVNLFQKSEPTAILVVGDAPTVTVATVEAALRALSVDTKRAKHQLCVAADRSSSTTLSAAADAVGIELLFVP